MSYDRTLFSEILKQALVSSHIHITDAALTAMAEFASLIADANQSLNLTRLIEPDEMAIKNFFDSLSLLRLETRENIRLLDLGTGAGFPGMPLALARPTWTIVLLDSLRKRLNFLDGVIKQLGLEKTTTLHARAEDAGQAKEHRERYDVVVSRAVASLPVLLELCTPLVKVGGTFVAFKASDAENELASSKRALYELQMELEQVFHMELPLAMGERNLLVFRKLAPTPQRYPRRAGLPSKQPLAD